MSRFMVNNITFYKIVFALQIAINIINDFYTKLTLSI